MEYIANQFLQKKVISLQSTPLTNFSYTNMSNNILIKS